MELAAACSTAFALVLRTDIGDEFPDLGSAHAFAKSTHLRAWATGGNRLPFLSEQSLLTLNLTWAAYFTGLTLAGIIRGLEVYSPA
jgi:hypothetical protein